MLLPAVLILLLSGGAAAQEDMLQGGLELDVQAGYSGYALPVANSELGRDWAERGSLTWQMAFNYSTVPVRITIMHRRADAFRGHIELISASSYSVEEDPLGHSEMVTTDFIVPPSVPYTVTLAPRVCPPSTPGGPARLLLRIYQQELQAPVVSEVITVTQLEPAYVYTLLLDGPPGQVFEDQVNPENERELALPEELDAVPGLLSTRNWLISCPHEQLTGMPLAARDFAFAAADLAAVSAWPQDEQLGLVQYMLGGGYLCLYNATDEQWQGLSLKLDALPVGRGYLRVVHGGLPEARKAMADWLGGELEEFALWSGGTAGADSLKMAQSPENLLEDLKLGSIFGRREEPDIVSHRPGFLHPIWIYREACRSGASEPWQGPEFLLNQSGGWKFNEALRVSIGSTAGNQVAPLAQSASAPRDLPQTWRWLALMFPGLFLIGGILKRGRPLLILLAIFCLGWLAWVWWNTSPPLARPITTTLLDADMNVAPTTLRTLVASETGWGGSVRMQLEQAPLVRHLSWRDSMGNWATGDWNLALSGDLPQFAGSGGGSYLAVDYDSPGAVAAKLPVSLAAHRKSRDRIILELDTSGLPPGTPCFLLSPMGWFNVQASSQASKLELEMPEVTALPGKQRLLEWQRVFTNWYERFGQQSNMMDIQSEALLRQIYGDYHLDELQPVEYYALLGALQLPNSHRGVLANQIVLYSLLPPADQKDGNDATVLRLTLCLEDLSG